MGSVITVVLKYLAAHPEDVEIVAKLIENVVAHHQSASK